jgi:hypothetical protein
MTTTPVPYRPFPTGLPPDYADTTDFGFSQSDGEIVGLNDGGFVIVWNDTSHMFNPGGTAVVGQKFDSLGNKIGGFQGAGEVQISQFIFGDDSLGAGGGSAITKLANGNLAIAYRHAIPDAYFTYVRIVEPFFLNVVRDDLIDGRNQELKNTAITSFADNSYVVSYTLDNGGGNTDVLARIVSPAGSLSAPITVRDNGTADAGLSQLATLSNNNFVVVWQELSTDYDIHFSIFTAAGSPILSNVPLIGGSSGVDETDPDVAALTGGGFVVAWTDAAGDGSSQGIRATILSNTGGTASGQFDILVNTTTTGNQNEASVVALKDGGFVVTWEDDFAFAVRGQRFDATGHRIGSEFLVKDNPSVPGDPSGDPGDSHDSALLADGRFAYALGDFSTGDNDVTTSIWDPRSRVNDFNGDATTDLLLHNNSNQGVSVWTVKGIQVMSSPIIGTQAAGWNITHTADFNGDGKSDLLLQNPSTLQASVWLMDGTTVTSSPIIGTEAPGWGVVHTADFNGGGKSDLLLQNGNSLAMWLMDGGTVTSNPVIGTMASGWNLTDYGDFNNDGKTDLLLQNPTTLQASVWLMNGTSVTSSPIIGTEAPGWGVVHVSDFTGDGKSDLLLQNGNALAMWLMNDTTVTASPAFATIAPGWNLTHYGDFNGDSKTDLLLENPTTRGAAVWLMNGAFPTSTPVIGTEAPGWGIVDVTDFNADGKSDLLLENSNHDLAVWLMDGTTVTANPVIGHIASGWDFLGF